jgi:hypothetical protein
LAHVDEGRCGYGDDQQNNQYGSVFPEEQAHCFPPQGTALPK